MLIPKALGTTLTGMSALLLVTPHSTSTTTAHLYDPNTTNNTVNTDSTSNKNSMISSSNNQNGQEPTAACNPLGLHDTTVDTTPTGRTRRLTSVSQWWHTLSPQRRATMYMAASMSCHYGGYEFIRNAGLALFTSPTTGFAHAAAFPLCYGLTSPISIALLYLYSRRLEQCGPRVTLRTTTAACIGFVVVTAALLHGNQVAMQFLTTASTATATTVTLATILKAATQAVVGLVFLFQNSYVYMLASQQWSFTDSIVTPLQAAQWFGAITGVSSIVCTITASLVPLLLPHTGLIGLYALTTVPLLGTMVCADRAYALAQKHGFDPSSLQKKNDIQQQQQQTTTPPAPAVPVASTTTTSKDSTPNSSSAGGSAPRKNRIADAMALFRRVPTLGALFVEGLSFQSLNTILNVAMIQALRMDYPNDDVARSAYTGRFYAGVSAISALFQFGLLPRILKNLEPKQIWRIMPVIPFLVALAQVARFHSIQLVPSSSSSLPIMAGAMFITKLMDYSLRSVVYNMVYQPLDYESRFMGKEIIGVFGSRFGKSGISLLLSGLTAAGVMSSSSLGPLSYLSLAVSASWVGSAWWLSNLLPTQAQAQKIVEQRSRHHLDKKDD